MKCTPRPPVTPERIAFEEWYKNSHTAASVLRTEKGYVNLVTRVAWRAWQAAKEDAKKPPKWNGKLEPGDIHVESFELRNGWLSSRTGIKLTHLPTKTEVSWSAERSAHRNKEKAWQLLADKLKEFK